MPNWGALRTLDWQERVFAYAVLASIVLHALLISLRFGMPEPRILRASQSLDVIIVNSKTRAPPVKPVVRAQTNLDGGGNTDAERRAKSPLPVSTREKQGDSMKEARQRLQELEALQRQLLTQAQAQAQAPIAVPSQAAKPDVVAEPQPKASGIDLANNALAMVKNLEAQISRNVDEFNKRPRKQFVGVRAAEYRFAQYVDDWRQKVERVGNLNYPDSARGKVYGSLRMSVSINPDGSLAAVELERSSGHKILDAAAERIVRMAAPYSKFPVNIRTDTDILVITRTWYFEQGDKLLTNY